MAVWHFCPRKACRLEWHPDAMRRSVPWNKTKVPRIYSGLRFNWLMAHPIPFCLLWVCPRRCAKRLH